MFHGSSDEWFSSEQHGFMNQDEYDMAKYNMIKSIYINAGFYIGRYEVGTIDDDITDDILQRKAQIKRDLYPYNYVTCYEAQKISSSLTVSSEKTASLMFGINYDLVLKFLENNCKEIGNDNIERRNYLKTQSSNIGNYSDSTFYITNRNAQYIIVKQVTGNIDGWNSISHNYLKQNSGEENKVLLSTGASDRNKLLNIYDLGGNVWEYTLEYTGNELKPCVNRGGNYSSVGSTFPISGKDRIETDGKFLGGGFRAMLY